MRLIFLAIFSLALLAGCSTVPGGHRNLASSQPGEDAKAAQYSFYIEQLPVNLRTLETPVRDAHFILKDCRPLNFKGTVDQRIQFFAALLNRPFYFANNPKPEAQINIVGNFADFKQFACISTAISELNAVDPGFLAKLTAATLPQERIDHHTLGLLINLWEDGARDMPTIKLIVSSGKMDHYLLQDIYRSVFQKQPPTSELLEFISALIKSNAYKKNSVMLTNDLLKHASLQVSTEGRFMIARMIADSQLSVNAEDLFYFAANNMLAEQDYSPLFRKLTAKQSADIAMKWLLQLFNSDASLADSQALFDGLWGQSLTDPTRMTVESYVMAPRNALTRLNISTIEKILFAKFSSPASEDDLGSILSTIRARELPDENFRLRLFDLVARQGGISSSVASQTIACAISLRNSQPLSEGILTLQVQRIAALYKGSAEVASMHMRYAQDVQDENSRMQMFADLLTLKIWDEPTLRAILPACFSARTKEAYLVVKMMLDQPGLTAFGLDEMAKHAAAKYWKMSAEDKELLQLIELHPRTSSETKEFIRSKLSFSQ